MKLNKLMAGLLLSGIALSGATTALAAEETTEGTVKFNSELATESYIILPGTFDERIQPEGGASATSGAMRINYVPDFNFGELGITSVNASYAADMGTYFTYNEDGTVSTTKKNIPQFAQVADASGNNAGGFTLKATATTFKEDVAVGGHELANTRIQFYSQTLKNNVDDKNGATTDRVSGLEAAATPLSTGAMTELNPTSDITILKTAAAGKTNGSTSSVVFADAYDHEAAIADGTKNEGVKLFVPGGESPRNAVYKSTITWTLSDEF